MTSDTRSVPRELLDPEVAKAAETVPFESPTLDGRQITPSSRRDGLPVWTVYPGGCHGFFVLAPDALVTQQCRRNLEDWLRRQLCPGP